MTLHYYFARKFLFYFSSVLVLFLIFISMIDFLEHLRRFGDDTEITNVMILAALNVPDTAYEIMPLVMILSSVWMFIALARSSELVVARSVGRSALQFLMAPGLVGLCLGVATVFFFNPIVAASQKTYDLKRQEYTKGGGSVLSIGAEGLWLRQGDATTQTVIRASTANYDGTRLFDVTMVELDSSLGPVRRIHAASASLENGYWSLEQVQVWPIIAGQNPQNALQRYDSFKLRSPLTQDQIRDRFGAPASISIWNLPAFIDTLQNSGFSAQRYIVWFQMEMARPLYLFVMVLVGASFSMRHTRFGGTGVSILMAVLLGFGLYYLRNFAQIFGNSGQLPAIIAAWTPPMVGLLLSLGIILHTEDG